jgi:small conductance mechanosensitive channel
MPILRRSNHDRPRVLNTSAARALREQAAFRARRARRQLVLVAPLTAAVLYAYAHRVQLFGLDEPIRIVAALVLAALGWWAARDVGRSIGPVMTSRLDVSTAGTVGFLIRLVMLGMTMLIALRIAGLEARSLAVGGAFTAVIIGLAAQTTIGNVISGLMLISARPFSVGERVRLQAGGVAGQIEGTATGFGLLYVTLARGDDTIMVPNNVVMQAAIVPLREPAAVDVRARVRPEIKPSELQDLLANVVQTPTRAQPHIALEEVDEDEVIMRVTATPESDADGPQLADEVLAAIGQVTSQNGNGRV